MTNTEHMKFAMPLAQCYSMGRQLASHGYDELQVARWIVDNNYRLNGTTHRRVLVAYNRQLANN